MHPTLRLLERLYPAKENKQGVTRKKGSKVISASGRGLSTGFKMKSGRQGVTSWVKGTIQNKNVGKLKEGILY